MNNTTDVKRKFMEAAALLRPQIKATLKIAKSNLEMVLYFINYCEKTIEEVLKKMEERRRRLIFENILKQKKAGLNLVEIAESLTSQSIPTPLGKTTKWNESSVRRVYKHYSSKKFSEPQTQESLKIIISNLEIMLFLINNSEKIIDKELKKIKERRRLSTFEIIKTLTELGMSFLKIAKFLTDQGIPALRSKKKWHESGVRRLYREYSTAKT